mmetsp:Transcript_120746/g.219597  ORF Transcript_120746/g.219597 Transcript_120746/m.219597 type:complete len:324 (-) Transcript_120746:115-1086(-)
MWQALRGARMMRRGHQALNDRSQGSFFYGDLWRFLYSGLPEGTVQFDHAVEDLGNDVECPTIDGEVFDLAILADGGWSKLRRYVTSTQPEYAGYVAWRGQVDAVDFPKGFDAFGMYTNGPFNTLALPMCKDDGRDVLIGGLFLATPEDEVVHPEAGASRRGDEGAKSSTVPEWFLPFYKKHFGRDVGGKLVKLFEAIMTKGDLKPHPHYDYAADKVNAGRVLLVGDAAHMASPALAAGANMAVSDALALREAFGSGSGLEDALRVYSRDALRRARKLHMQILAVRPQFLPNGGLAAVQSPSKLVTLRGCSQPRVRSNEEVLCR